METERKILLKAFDFEPYQSNMIDFLKYYDPKNPKSAEASAEARKKGNDLLLKNKRHDAETHKAIFSLYCESIALAPMEFQELALAYGNRSYLLLHMHKYEESIEDIDRALKLSNSDVLKAKLLCRKAECRKRLGSDISSILKMVETVADTVDDKNRETLLKMIDAVNALDVGAKKEGMNSMDLKRKADLNLAITNDFSSCVSIEYNEKYGRHLVAAKDYQPGDIIFVEKMYATAFVDGSSLLACDYCVKPLWSSIPCNYCNWAMYCSESCKEKAWNEYHDIDCSLISYLKQWLQVAWKPVILAVRIMIMGIKETGGIANLKKEIELLARDGSSRDFFKNGQFTLKSIQSVYSLVAFMPDECTFKISTVIPYILISLTKYSKLKDDFNVKQMEDLKMNQDIMFLGSLLIKLVAVLNVNSLSSIYDDAVKNEKSMLEHSDMKRCLGIVFSLLNHSCFPSADWTCTESNKIVVYALQPIKKHSQIFVRYQYGFENELRSVRQAKFTQKYNFTCGCRACVENWRPIKMPGDVDYDKKEVDIIKDIDTGKFSIEDLQEIMKVLPEGRQVDKLHVEKLSALITRAMHWRQPSHMFCNLIGFLREMFNSIYSPKPLVFNECR